MSDNLTLTFGKHKGVRIQRVPVNYLLWMVNQERITMRDEANAELKRRGTVLPELDVSGHAIDRASLNPKLRAIWHETSNKDEGLHAWLVRISHEAISKGICEKTGDEVVAFYLGMKIVYEVGYARPVVKTVMSKDRCRTKDMS